ncbi:VTT domain-containing protein [Ramlibacter sp. AW1]|uniref:VTT domain-containing protein n=1 Tax=Ramlibacter aurantiacus TaxID=2801330 RepID=A0A936ZHI6_9BURK|nr:VTT domain-containing protein [Ramlibacter aurantiacus]MBL0419972.1 VTT domain-containing protein [Ramlibacter aurantiacus]
MNPGALLLEHGYAVLALGLLLEGETAVLLGGFAAHRGWLELPWVFALAVGLPWLSDQALFWLGRWKGAAVLVRWRRLARAAVRARRLVRRYPHACVLGVRFAYGMRTAGPLLIGASGLPPVQFALLSALAAVLWAGTYCTLGWVFAETLQRVLGHAREFQLALLGVMLTAAALAWWLARRRSRARARTRAFSR